MAPLPHAHEAGPVPSSDASPDAPWHALSSEEVLRRLTTTEQGLTKPEAAARLLSYGPNTMTPGKSRTLWHMIWEQLYNIITVILLAAAVIKGVFRDWIEVGFVLAVVVANVAIGVVQEGRAEAATKAIKAMVSAQAVVMRNGRKVTVDAVSLVPGDILHLTAGDRIPADLRILEASGLQVTEAMLTGESVPVSKDSAPVRADSPLGDRTCMGFTGTLVFTGQGVGIVVSTGDSAEIGKINTLMASVDTAKTPLLAQIEHFGFNLSIACIFMAVLAFVVAYAARGLPLEEAFAAGVGVAVALIPEGLPTVVTITLAFGVQAMARSRAIIRQLPAVETLGAVTCICSDKTGTLTKNEMTAVGVHTTAAVLRVTGTGYNPDGDVKYRDEPLDRRMRDSLRQLLLPAALCNDSTLMPAVSAHAQQMLATQPLALPQLLAGGAGSSGPGALAANLPTDAPLALPSNVEAMSSEVGSAIVQAMTTAIRVVTWGTTGDPTEAALLALVMKAGLNLKTLSVLASACPRLGTLPFSSEHKFMATVHDIAAPARQQEEADAAATASDAAAATVSPAAAAPPAPAPLRRLLMVKGAPDVLLARCSTQAKDGDPWTSEPIDRARWLAANSALSKEGLRVLALCWKELPRPDASSGDAGAGGEVTVRSTDVLEGEPSLQLNCLVAIVDPPRDEAIRAVQSCHVAGITVKMITGDHADTAKTIGGWIGIETSEVLTGPVLERMTDDELATKVEGCNIYARASPEHKLRIVRALQKHGHIVAMTGDGVNDAPALRQANVGVAMGIAGTEVAKEAARMILQDDNFATIEAAIRQGRCTYDNLRKLIAFILPTSIAQGISIAVAVFIGQPAPLTSVQILYVNMVTAATLGLVLAIEKPEENIMQRPPRRQGKPLVGKLIAWRSIFVGAAMIVAMLGQQAWTLANGGSDRAGHTMAMNTLVVSQCLYCLSCRFMTQTSLSISAIVTNPWLSSMIVLNAALQCLITYVPGVQDVWETESITGIDWLRILLFACAIFVVVELEKAFGPALVRPYVLPLIQRATIAVGCGVKKGPAPFIVRSAEIAHTVSESEKIVRAQLSSAHLATGGVDGSAGGASSTSAAGGSRSERVDKAAGVGAGAGAGEGAVASPKEVALTVSG
jgi:magnesium-transporting ATPase (P-type)